MIPSMQPERRRRKSSTVGRARMMIKAHLAWLPGYPIGVKPDGVEWMAVFRPGGRAPERRIIGREQLHEAMVTHHKLTRRFPKAFPRAVEDHRAWARGVPAVVEHVKGAVQRGQPLPPNLFEDEGVYGRQAARRARSLLTRQPSLARLVDALSWVEALTPRHLVQTLDRIEPLEDRFVALLALPDRGIDPLCAAVQLAVLMRADGSRFVAPVLERLVDPRVRDTPVAGRRRYLEELVPWLKNPRPDQAVDPPPKNQIPGPHLARWLAWSYTQPAKVRRQVDVLLDRVWPESLSSEWAALWRDLEETRVRLEAQWKMRARRSTATASEPDRAGWEQTVETSLERVSAKHPPRLYPEILFGDLRALASKDRGPLRSAVTSALERVPEVRNGACARATLLHHWVYLGHEYTPAPAAEMIRLFRALLGRRKDDPDVLAPWDDLFAARLYGRGSADWVHDEALLSDHPDRSSWRRVFEAIERAMTERPGRVGSDQADQLLVLFKEIGEPAATVRRLVQLIDAEEEKVYFDPGAIGAAHLLAGDEGDFPPLLNRLEGSEVDADSVFRACSQLRTADGLGLARDAIREGAELSGLVRAGGLVRFLQALKKEVPSPPSTPGSPDAGWLQRYPAALLAALSQLDAITADAEDRARKLLSRWFPDPGSLQRQLRELQRRIEQGRDETGKLARRAETLRRQLEGGVAVKPSQLAKARGRVVRAAFAEQIQNWTGMLDAIVRDEVAAILQPGGDDEDERPAALEVLDVLPHVVELSAQYRALGTRLLRLRTARGPTDLRAAPPNASFIARIRQRGIDIQPWIDGMEPRTVQGGGRTFRLAFADDPLDILRMGAPFKTCLSPGAFNFFSAVVNAADINKRVLFAWDDQGRVAARCLMALTDPGAIVCFHTYRAAQDLDFQAHVRTFAVDLAQAMGTAVVTSGHVSPLMTSDWYDDGPVDLAMRFEFLEEGSEFRRTLADLDPSEVVAAFEREFDPLPLNELTLGMALGLDEIASMPQLAVPLVRRLARSASVDMENVHRAVHLLSRTSDRAVLREIVVRHPRVFVADLTEAGYGVSRLLDVLVEVAPRHTVRLLRAGEPSRSDTYSHQEWTRHMLLCRGRALEHLGRRRRALKCYERLLALEEPNGPPGQNRSRFALAADERLSALR